MGMKQITDSGGRPDVFELGRNGGGLWLHAYWTEPNCGWGPGSKVVFRLRLRSPARATADNVR